MTESEFKKFSEFYEKGYRERAKFPDAAYFMASARTQWEWIHVQKVEDK